jgi:peptidoglycan/LPS O-acetylase OafA/YrhL
VKYRPEIDGLRALAVVPVILFHAEFNLFSGELVVIASQSTVADACLSST